MKNPKISVVLSVYNGEDTLSIAIDSVLNQTYKDFEFIIINDGSTDDSLKIIEKYRRQDDRVIAIDRENKGLANSLNEGVELSKGKYIARMDQDDICFSKRFEKQVDFLENNTSVDMLFTGWEEVDIDSLSRNIKIPKREWFKNLKKYFFTKSMILLHPTLMANSDVMKRYPYPDLRRRGEDYKMFLDMIVGGVKFDILEEPLLEYYASNKPSDFFRKKIHWFSVDFLPILNSRKNIFKFNIFFWIMYLRTFIAKITTVNMFVYRFFYINLKNIFERFFK